MKPKAVSLLLIIVCLFTLVMPGCAKSPVPTPPPAAPPAKVKVLLLPFLSFAPFFIAEQEGYFAEQGLQIEYIRLDRGTEAIVALAQNDLDVYAGAINLGILKAMRGTNIRIVADKGYFDPNGCTYMSILVRKELAPDGEFSASELLGKQVNMSARGNIREYYFDSVLESAGLDSQMISFTNVPDEGVGEALKNGSIDISPITEPWVTRILEDGHSFSWMPSEQVLPGYHFTFIAYSDRFRSQSPDVGRRFMVAYLKALRQYNQGKTERNLEILAQATSLERQFLLDSCWGAIRPDGYMSVEDVLSFQDWAIAKGLLDQAPLTAEQIWDPTFVEAANQALNAVTP
ncbi:MAG: ABC transporter substrate-binding protein [Anaerolineales bacterium]|nr:ABC transporter substrate-binding protein [Anaerolineales bacterium]